MKKRQTVSIKALFFAISAILFVSSCQHSKVKNDGPQRVFSKSKVKSQIQVKNLKNGKIDFITSDALVDDVVRMRMEARASFGVLAAVLVFRSNQFEFWIPMRNKAGRGELTAASVRRSLGVELDPQIFYVVLADQDFRDKSWTCKTDELGFKTECANARLQAKVQWQERDGMKRKLLITTPQNELVWLVTHVEEVKDFKDADFKIKWGESTQVEQF